MVQRNTSIDAFRGISILAMVFFTFTLTLSSNLPDLLKHNVRGAAHLGDLVLPMFLFASGLSLAYYFDKRDGYSPEKRRKDFGKRFLKLALVAVLLSPFSGSGFLEMDEIMLSALCFLACFMLYRRGWFVNVFLIVSISISYAALAWLGWTDVFQGHYIGGYPAALCYLPVMLAGLLVGQGIIEEGLWCKKNKAVVVIVALLFIILLPAIPVGKLAATPTFMMLGILLSLALYVAIEGLMIKAEALPDLQYLGRTPLRYWILMYALALIPLKLYRSYHGGGLRLDWQLAIMVTACIMLALWLASNLVDVLQKKYDIKI